MSGSWPMVAAKVVATVWLVSLSLWDHLHRRVPNWMVLPAMGIALGWQIYVSLTSAARPLGFIAIAWIVVFMLWQAHIFGGGDAKFLMALLAMFPSVHFLVFFSLVVLVVSLPLLVVQVIKTRSLPFRRVDGGTVGLPSAEDLQKRGRPYCWTLALPGALYLWWIS